MIRSTDECEMSRSCQSATFSSPAPRLPRSTRASPLSCSLFTGLRLCGIARRALLLPGPERLLHLAHLGALEVADLGRERLDRPRRRWRTRTAARRGGRGRAPGSRAPAVRPSRSHTYCSTDGSTFEYVPTAPESLPTAITSRARRSRSMSRRTCSAQSASLTPNVVGSAWMPCVRPTIGVSRYSCACSVIAASSATAASMRRSRGPGQLQRQRGVDDVARREAVVDPGARGLADPLLDHVDERGDVVLGDELALLDRGDVEAGALAHRGRGVLRDDAELGPGLGGEDLDLEPGAEARLVGEEVGHLGQGVAGDHVELRGHGGGDVGAVLHARPGDPVDGVVGRGPGLGDRRGGGGDGEHAAAGGPDGLAVLAGAGVEHVHVVERGGVVEAVDRVAGARRDRDSPRSRARRRRTRRR